MPYHIIQTSWEFLLISLTFDTLSRRTLWITHNAGNYIVYTFGKPYFTSLAIITSRNPSFQEEIAFSERQ